MLRAEEQGIIMKLSLKTTKKKQPKQPVWSY